jgi:hypothetical protein
MKNVVLWDIRTQFIPRRKHITSPLQSPAGLCYVRFEVFTAVTVKNAVFWDIKTQFVPHRKNITSPLQSPASSLYARSKDFTAVTMKNVVFWDIRTQFILRRKQITSPLQSPAGLCFVRFEAFTVVTMKNAVSRDVTSCGSWMVLTRDTRRNIPEDGNLQTIWMFQFTGQNNNIMAANRCHLLFSFKSHVEYNSYPHFVGFAPTIFVIIAPARNCHCVVSAFSSCY